MFRRVARLRRMAAGTSLRRLFMSTTIGRVDGHVGARPDGDAQVRPGEGGGVVDAVPDHGDLPLLLELADHPLLPVGKDPGDHLVHPGLAADGLGGAGIVPG